MTNSKLKGYRVMCGLTQDEMGKYIGSSRVMYVCKENGKYKFSAQDRELILKKLHEQIPELKMEDVFGYDY